VLAVELAQTTKEELITLVERLKIELLSKENTIQELKRQLVFGSELETKPAKLLPFRKYIK
jgi:hypothetical protein